MSRVFESGRQPLDILIATNRNQQCSLTHSKCLTVAVTGLPYLAFIHSQILIEYLLQDTICQSPRDRAVNDT